MVGRIISISSVGWANPVALLASMTSSRRGVSGNKDCMWLLINHNYDGREEQWPSAKVR